MKRPTGPDQLRAILGRRGWMTASGMGAVLLRRGIVSPEECVRAYEKRTAYDRERGSRTGEDPPMSQRVAQGARVIAHGHLWTLMKLGEIEKRGAGRAVQYRLRAPTPEPTP